MKEFQALGLDISIINDEGKELDLKEIEEEEQNQDLRPVEERDEYATLIKSHDDMNDDYDEEEEEEDDYGDGDVLENDFVMEGDDE